MKDVGKLVAGGHRKGDRVRYVNSHYRKGWAHDALVVGEDKTGRVGILLVDGPVAGRRMYVTPNNVKRKPTS